MSLPPKPPLAPPSTPAAKPAVAPQPSAELPIDGLTAVHAATRITTVPLLELAQALHLELLPVIRHSALIIFTRDCVGKPQKTAGDPRLTGAVTIVELEQVRQQVHAGMPVTQAHIGGATVPVKVVQSPTDSLLILCQPEGYSEAAELYVQALWGGRRRAHPGIDLRNANLPHGGGPRRGQ